MENVKTLDKQTAAFLGAVVQQIPRLSAIDMQRYIERPGELAKLLSDAFLSPSFKTWVKRLEPWKIVRIGGPQNVGEICEEIKKAGMKIDEDAYRIIENISLSKSETDVKIVLLSLKDMFFGGYHDVDYGNICRRARDLGLELCPAEIALRLRLQCKDLPNRETYIAMNPIVDSAGKSSLLTLVNRGIFDTPPSISVCPGYLRTSWMTSCDDMFVFVLP